MGLSTKKARLFSTSEMKGCMCTKERFHQIETKNRKGTRIMWKLKAIDEMGIGHYQTSGGDEHMRKRRGNDPNMTAACWCGSKKENMMGQVFWGEPYEVQETLILEGFSGGY